jgi:hypothetical protein
VRLGQLALAVALVVIAFARLSPESGRDTTDFRLLSQVRDMIVHRDRELLRDNLGNLLLFVPFGLALALCGVSLGASLALGFSVSLAVEVANSSSFQDAERPSTTCSSTPAGRCSGGHWWYGFAGRFATGSGSGAPSDPGARRPG